MASKIKDFVKVETRVTGYGENERAQDLETTQAGFFLT